MGITIVIWGQISDNTIYAAVRAVRDLARIIIALVQRFYF